MQDAEQRTVGEIHSDSTLPKALPLERRVEELEVLVAQNQRAITQLAQSVKSKEVCTMVRLF